MSIVSRRVSSNHCFILFSNVQELEWTKIAFTIEIMKLLKLAILKLPAKLRDSDWDFAMCSMVSWIQVCTYPENLAVYIANCIIHIN